MCYTVNPWPSQCILGQHEFVYTCKTNWEQLVAKHGKFEYVPSSPDHNSERPQFSDLNVRAMSSFLTT